MRISRRQLLRQSASALLGAGLWPGALAAAERDTSEPFGFLVVNDTHYLDNNCGPWLERVVRQMKTQPQTIDFCLMLGDLSEHGRANQIRPVLDIFKALGKPVYYVIGNHDYLTQTDRSAFEELVARKLNYNFEHAGWQFLALDTTFGQESRGTAIQPETMRWLDELLPRLDKKMPTVLFTHFPLGPLVPGRPTNAKPLLERLKEFNVQACFSGHFHAFTERRFQGIDLTTNRCCSRSRQNHDGDKKKGYFVCQAKAGKIERTFVETQIN